MQVKPLGDRRYQVALRRGHRSLASMLTDLFKVAAAAPRRKKHWPQVRSTSATLRQQAPEFKAEQWLRKIKEKKLQKTKMFG